MKKVLSYIFRIIVILALILIATLLGFKIYEDAEDIKIYEEEQLNIQAESQYFIDTITFNLSKIKEEIEKDIDIEVEIADTGSLSKTEICFVAYVDGKYKYIVTKNVDGIQRFSVSESDTDTGKYIVSSETLGLKDCVYTDIEKYIIDKDGNISYLI